VLTRGEPVAEASLVVLYEFPGSREVLRTLAGGRSTVVALVTPRQLPALRALAGAGRVTPFTLSGPGARAQRRAERLRAELRALLAEGPPAQELLALEPLLAEFDGAEIAAAALRLLERERERVREAAAQAERAGAGRPAPARIFINAGARDNVSPRDIVGAISNEAGIPGDRIGRVDLRDNHTLVEVAAADAERVVSRMTGTMLRGRRIVARIDQDRPPRERAPRARSAPHERGEFGRARREDTPSRSPRASRE
jgi:ATP-dependent RNA helicase DeaD